MKNNTRKEEGEEKREEISRLELKILSVIRNNPQKKKKIEDLLNNCTARERVTKEV